ncbi:MAG: GAF domain-containing protein [Anaerolineae bacterium]|nr:GAF domain-containing protein [Anaerolineae bacterium]
MVRNNTPYIPQSQRLRRRAANRITLIVLIAFLIIGLLSFLGIRTVARENLERTHVETLQSVSQEIDTKLNQTYEDIQFLTTNSAIRTFASAVRATGGQRNSAAIESAQTALAQTFATTLVRNPEEYLAIRYVDLNGDVWSEVRQENGTPHISLDSEVTAQTNDATFLQGLQAPLNTMVTSELRFLTYAGSDELVEPLTPYVRFMTPTSTDTDSMTTAGMVQIDVALAQILNVLTTDTTITSVEGRRVVLIDDQTTLIADTSLTDANILRRIANGFGVSLESQLPALANAITTNNSAVRANVIEGVMASSLPIALTGANGTPWSLLLLDNAGSALDSATLNGILALLGSVMLGGIVGVVLQTVLRDTMRPLDQTAMLAMQIADAAVDPAQQTGVGFTESEAPDEITLAIENLRLQVQSLSQTLDMRTEHYRHNLELAARISRETATVHDLSILINRTLDLICDSFGFYHAQVFLVDEAGVNAVLRYSHGSAGQRLLAQEHKLAVGSASVIGQVTVKGEPVVVNDTSSETSGPHHFNPVLATTRAEMALPLTIGRRTIGALDIQSETANVFREDEVQIFQLLADQLAIAIQNARLLIETEARVEQIDRLNQQFIRSAWEKTLETGEIGESYYYDLMQVERGTPKDTGKGLRIPLTIRGVVIGEIEANAGADRKLSEGDEAFMRAVADRIGLAIENARLLGETQNTLAETFSLYELSRSLSEAANLEDVIRAINLTVVTDATGGQIGIFKVDATDITQVNLEITNTWTRREYEEATGTLLHLQDHSLLTSLTPNQVILVQDIASDGRVDAELRSLLQTSLGAKAAVLIPISVRGSVRGVLTLGFPTVRAFSQRDGRIFAALIDQASVAIDNRLLVQQNEQERERLDLILETLPAGVIVLDPQTLRPLQANQQAQTLLGQVIDSNTAFTIEGYNLYRTGTNAYYPATEMPVFSALANRHQEFCDDITVYHPDGLQIDLLANAAPILNEQGQVSAIVAAFQDISTLRNLENTLQENLRETILLYETTRSLAEAPEVGDVIDLMLAQLSLQDASEVYLVMTDEKTNSPHVIRSLSGLEGEFPLPQQLLDVQQPLFISDVAHPRQLEDEATRIALMNQGIRSLIVAPLRVQFRDDSPPSWVVMAFADQQDFSIEREQSFVALIDSVAVTLDNRYLVQSTQVALDTTAALYTATSTISRAQDLNELSESIQEALHWLKADIYAGFVRSGDVLQPMFNVNLDGGEIDFSSLLEMHRPTDAVFIQDLQEVLEPTPFEQELFNLGILRAFGMVPIRLQARFEGYVLIGYHRAHSFSEGETRYMAAIADSSSVMIDNLLLLDQIQDSLQETSVLYLSSRELSDALNEEDIVQVIVNHLLDRSANQVFVCSFDNGISEGSENTLRVVAHWQSETDEPIDFMGIMLSSDYFPAWRILSSEDLMLIDDVETDEHLSDAERQGLQSLGLRSVSVLPLSGRTQRLGVILIGDNAPFKHSDREERIYGSFAEQASLRLEASRLLIQTERRARQLTTSARVGQLASSLEELSRLLPTIVDLIKEAFGYDHAQIFLMDEEHRFAVLSASTGEAGEQLLAAKHKLEKGSQSVIGQVTATGEPVLALDTSLTGAVHRPNRFLPNTRAEIAVPLILKGRVVGALDVQSNTPNFFNQDDISVLTTLAAQISVAIDNAALYEESQARAKDMYFLFTVATAAAGADTLSETMQNITLALQELLEAAAVSVYLPVELTDGEITITELRPVAIAGSDMPLSEISEIRLGETDTLHGRSASELRPYIIGDISEEHDYVPIIGDAQSAIIVPLSVGNQLISLLTMESLELNAYDDDTLTLLLTLSGTLSAIVQNQKLLEELQQTNEQLLELDRLKSDFLANMSHELRTPLNSIIGFSRVILKGIDGPLTEMQEQDLTTIYNSGQHLLNLINDILDQAKIAAGKMDLQCDYFDIKPVIESVRSIGIGLVKDKPIDIIVHMAPGMPKAYGDEFRTRQVLLNLVSNAAKFTKEGSITLNTYTQDEPTGETFICIEVTDTGIGIAEQDLPLLFEAFRQIDSSLTKTQSGTGLGLPIAKSLVEMQGGQMTVQSEINVGSTFAIYIPIAPSTAPLTSTQEMQAVSDGSAGTNGTHAQKVKAPPPPKADELEEEAAPASQITEKQPVPISAPKPTHFKRQVLLIEDNPDMVDQFRRVLQRDGFDVFTASITLEAEAMASGLHPSLIILDANFAGDTGWEILSRLQQRDDTADIPVIVVALSDEHERALENGAFTFIRKPFMPEVLAQAAKDAETEAQRDRILIIDDEPNSVRLLNDILADAGKYRVFWAANGVEGVSMVARRRPDLVIVDLRMPEMDGFQVIQELRGNPETAAIPIMVVTGDTLNETEMTRLSLLKVIYKPDLDMQGHRQFVETVKQHLSTTNGDHRG